MPKKETLLLPPQIQQLINGLYDHGESENVKYNYKLRLLDIIDYIQNEIKEYENRLALQDIKPPKKNRRYKKINGIEKFASVQAKKIGYD